MRVLPGDPTRSLTRPSEAVAVGMCPLLTSRGTAGPSWEELCCLFSPYARLRDWPPRQGHPLASCVDGLAPAMMLRKVSRPYPLGAHSLPGAAGRETDRRQLCYPIAGM